jgi:hypothetical protein
MALAAQYRGGRILNIDGLGRFIVSPSEHLVVLVAKQKDIFLATFSDVAGANNWTSAANPTALSEQRTLNAPSAVGAGFNFTIQFDFRPDATGAQDMTDNYSLQLTGSISGAAQADTISPPPVKIRSYSFVTA